MKIIVDREERIITFRRDIVYSAEGHFGMIQESPVSLMHVNYRDGKTDSKKVIVRYRRGSVLHLEPEIGTPSHSKAVQIYLLPVDITKETGDSMCNGLCDADLGSMHPTWHYCSRSSKV